MRKRGRTVAASGAGGAAEGGGAAAAKRSALLLLEAASRAKGQQQAKPPRGHLMLTALSAGVALQASLEDVLAVSADRWPALVQAFDALNPRSFIPISSTLSLLGALGKTSAVKAFRSWSEGLARPGTPADDEERHRRMSAALSSLMRGDYVWIPALAWLLERLSWDAIYALTVQAFGPNHAAGTANTNYRHVEAAILRENLLRHHVRLEEIWLSAFGAGEQAQPPAPKDGRLAELRRTPPGPPRLAVLVLRIARLHVADRYRRAGPMPPAWLEGLERPPSQAEAKALAQGLLGQVLAWQPEPHEVRAGLHAVLRGFSRELPSWALLYLQVVP
jgi:hypothetical protein